MDVFSHACRDLMEHKAIYVRGYVWFAMFRYALIYALALYKRSHAKFYFQCIYVTMYI